MTNNNLYPVFAYGKWGAVDREGNQAIPIIYTYDEMTMCRSLEATIIVIKNDKYGVLEIDSCQEIIPTVYDDIRCYDEELCCVLRDKIWYVWVKGSFQVIGEYDSVSILNKEFIQFEKALYTVFGNDDVSEEFIYSIAEKTIIPKSEAHIFYEDLAMICIDRKYGFINRSLELIIPAIYDYVENFDNGFAYTEKGDVNYYIDMQGQQVISGVFKHKYPKYYFYNDLALVYIEGKYGFVNRSLELVIPAIYDHAESFGNGFAYVGIGNENYYIDTEGKQAISEGSDYKGSPCIDYDDNDPDEYDGDYMFMEGIRYRLTCYKENGLIGLKTVQNQIVTSPIYDFIHLTNEYNSNETKRLICVIKDKKYGVINNEGNIVIECEYDDLSICPNSENLIVVGKGNWNEMKYGIIDIKNNHIIPPIYRYINVINNNLAIVRIEDEKKYGVLNIFSQEFVITAIYDKCRLYNDLFLVEKDNKWGYLDFQGNEVMKIEQDFDYYIYSGYSYYPHYDGRWGWGNYCGQTLDLSKCSPEKEIYFKNWKPITGAEDVLYENNECPF